MSTPPRASITAMLEPLRKRLPLPVRNMASHVLWGWYYLWDQVDKVRGRDSGLTPPRHLIYTIGSSFYPVGQEYLGYFKTLGHLTPDEAVLDIGSGVGRMALPLTTYLSPQGRYDGFDIGSAGIRWCQQEITPRYPNFRFQHVALKNAFYTKSGADAAQFRFPYPDSHFDFVFATSLFTHLLPSAMQNYIAESARVLKPGGRLLATFFLLTDEAKTLVAQGKSSQNFIYDRGTYHTTNPHAEEGAIAFPEAAVYAELAKVGLTLEPPVHYGNWCGRSDYLSYQDIIVARKTVA
jgi:SAM-dependent methyltransferase